MSSYSRRSAVADSLWSVQDRVRGGLRDARERASYGVQERLIWPLQDRAGTMSSPLRAFSFFALVLLAAGAGVAGLLLASPEGSEDGTGTRVAVAPEPRVEVKAAAVEQPPEPTLHGAAPVFKPPAAAGASEVDPAQAIAKKSPPTNAEPEDEPAAAASTASASAATARTTPEEAGLNGPAAGPKGLAVARDFSEAFVVYETGGLDAEVRAAFGATATPQLSKALLRRPPRLPANVEVPRAKVLNVVAGPSRDGVYSVSVSLLRVGVTSELRLDLEQRKGKEWRVTNVLG